MAEGQADKDGTLCDRYLSEIETNEQKGNSDATFFGERGRMHAYGGFFDLFVAGQSRKYFTKSSMSIILFIIIGTDTTATFLDWSVLHGILSRCTRESFPRDQGMHWIKFISYFG